jgi:hypothetical protein
MILLSYKKFNQKSMGIINSNSFKSIVFILFFGFVTSLSSAQNQNPAFNQPSEFWSKVQFGGGFGLSFSSGYTQVGLAPSAIYNFNEMVALGAGFQISYTSSSGYYDSFLYGINSILLYNPFPPIQLSLGFSESRVNYDYNGFENDIYSDEDYWDTALTVGVGYRAGNVTFGLGYNLIQNDYYDTNPIVPFVRAYF